MDFENESAGHFGDWALPLILRGDALISMVSASELETKAKEGFLAWATSANENYRAIAHVLHNGHDLADGSQLHDLHRLRVEACLSIVNGHWQAAVSLTNILLEMFLKLALIYSNSQERAEASPPLTAFMGSLASATQKYRQMNLNNTIDLAHKQGLFDDATSKSLHTFRKRFRNSFFHADMQSMFGDETTPITGADFGTFEIEHGDVPISGLPLFWGEAMWQTAKANAIPYFLEVDSVIRTALPKVFPNSSKQPSDGSAS